MEIGKIVGSITSVSKIDELRPVKLFLVQLLNNDLKLKEDYVVAIDSVGAGHQDMVIITTGSGSRFTEITEPTHTDAAIIARIDNLEI